VGNRKGWRLPTIQELASLMDPTVPSPPTLPVGHPFGSVQSDLGSFYWSATTSSGSATAAWVVFFNNGNENPNVDSLLKLGAPGQGQSGWAWCVRGGQGVDPQ
jgi:hypothetical protein